MNENMNSELRRRNLTTADLAASANRPTSLTEEADAPHEDADADASVSNVSNRRDASLAPLFPEDMAGNFRARWAVVQQGFVDDPQNAVREGDELVAQVIKSLAETFSKQRAALEGEQASTENLRMALRRYRSFFERLLSI